MEAPDNICLFRNPIGVVLDSWYSLDSNAPFEKIEYVRKDAFIEKAEKWLKEHVLEYVPDMNFGVGKTDPDYYTKHFIDDYINYMKG